MLQGFFSFSQPSMGKKHWDELGNVKRLPQKPAPFVTEKNDCMLF